MINKICDNRPFESGDFVPPENGNIPLTNKTEQAAKKAFTKAEAESKMDKDLVRQAEKILVEPLESIEGEVDVRWATVEQIADDKDLPPIIHLDELEKYFNSVEHKFIKKWLDKFDLKGRNDLAIYAWDKKVNHQIRYLIIPIFKEGKLDGCRVIHSLNKTQKNASGQKIKKPSGKIKTLSNAYSKVQTELSTQKGNQIDMYASLRIVISEDSKPLGDKHLQANEEVNFRKVKGQDGFVQTLYVVNYFSKKGKLKRKCRYIQKHAGVNLFNFINAGEVDDDQRRSITKQLLAILKLLQKNEWIHSDIKPENIYVSESGKVVLGDLESMKPITSEKGNLRVTWMCCSPEIVKANFEYDAAWEKLNKAKKSLEEVHLDALNLESLKQNVEDAQRLKDRAYKKLEETHSYASDLWSLGVVFYALWTINDPPWADKDKATVLKNLRDKSYTDEIKQNLKVECVPEDIQQLILACLNEDPHARMKEVSSVIHKVLLHDSPLSQ